MVAFDWGSMCAWWMVMNVLSLSVSLCPAVDARASPSGRLSNPWRSSSMYLEDLEKTKLFSGDVAVARHGKIVFKKGYGRASFELDVPNGKEYAFKVGSITKTFVAVSLYQLEGRGLLKTSDTVEKYFNNSELGLLSPWCPKVAGKENDTKCHVPTIKQLLSMSAGLLDFATCSLPHNASDSSKLLRQYCYPGPNNITAAITSALPRLVTGTLPVLELVKVLLMVPALVFTPGERFYYSNPNFFLAQYVIEKVSRQSFADYLRNHVIGPAGISMKTGFDLSDGAKAIIPGNLLLNGYLSRHNETGAYVAIARYPSLFPNVQSLAAGAGGMQSTVDDLIKWFYALFVTPQVLGLSSNSIRELVYPHTLITDPRMAAGYENISGTLLAYSQGMVVRTALSGNDRPSLYGAVSITGIGSIEGFSARVVCIPYPQEMSKSTIVAVVSNMEVSASESVVLDPRVTGINQEIVRLCSRRGTLSKDQCSLLSGSRTPAHAVSEKLASIWTQR